MSKKGKTKIIKCSICGLKFETSYSGGVIRCSECSKNKAAALERPYTRDTVFLVCKWFGEGTTIPELKQIIFLLTVLAMFLIAGSMDNGDISFGAAAILSAGNFIIMAWSGFSSGLLAVYDKKEEFIILNRNMKNISPEKQQKLIEMASVIFKEDFKE